jgi:putative aldouronate transport system substrate-binding protein
MSVVSRRAFLSGSGKVALGAGLAAVGVPSLSACSSSPKSGAAGDGVVSYQFLGNPNESDAGAVSNALNAILKEKGKGFTVSLEPVQNYTQAMTLKSSAGQLGDMFFTAPWATDYYRLAAGKSLLALDDLLPAHAPTLWNSVAKTTWDAVRVNGKIYGAINQQRFPKLWGFVAQQKLVDKYRFDVASITHYEELEPFLATVKQREHGIVPWATDSAGNNTIFNPELFGWDPVASAYGLAVRYDDENLQVFNMYDTPEFKAAAEVSRRWHEAGYAVSSPLSNADAAAQNSGGKVAVLAGQTGPTNPQYFPFPTVGKVLVPTPLLNTDGVSATLTGINSHADNPEHAAQLLEMLNSDRDFYNTICFGIKGTHWVFTDESLGVVGFPAGQSAANSKWNPNTDWVFGKQFNAYYRSVYDAQHKRWEAEAEVNRTAATSKAIGFALDTTPIKTQIATLSAALGQYRPQVVNGLQDAEKGVSTLLKNLDNAGMQKVLSEAQKQLDAFKKSRG